jgi:hypothetical protein
MKAVLRRLRMLNADAAVARRSRTAPRPATEQWLAVLRCVLPGLERAGHSLPAEAAIRRTRESIVLLEEVVAAGDERPWPYLEYFCHACQLRLAWRTPAWEGRRLAVLDDDYDEHVRQIIWIERGRYCALA